MNEILKGLKYAQENGYSISIQQKDGHYINIDSDLFCFTEFALVVFEDEDDPIPLIYQMNSISSILVGKIYKAQ